MSLIQEALKRKQNEGGKVPLPSAQVLPPVQGVAARRPSGSVVALRVFCYAILSVGALAGILSLFLSFRTAPAPQVAQAAPEVEQPVPEPAPPIARRPLELVDPLEGVRTDRQPRRVSVRERPSTSDRIMEKVIPKRWTGGPAAWPDIKVMGVFARPEPDPSTAIVNGEVEEAGATIEGARIVQVRQSGVLFSFRGEEKFVRVGRSTIR